jgi:hypothetical protein
VVLLPFLEVTDTLVQSILAYVLVLLPVGALLYGLLALAADLMYSAYSSSGPPRDREGGGRRSSRRSSETLLKRPAL